MDSRDFFYTLGQALYQLDGLYANLAKESSVSPALLWVLYALNDGRPHTQKDICENWAMPKSTVNTIITQLKEQGFVQLQAAKGQRRAMWIVLTPAGQAYAQGLLEDIYALEARAFKRLSSADKQVPDHIAQILQALETSMEK